MDVSSLFKMHFANLHKGTHISKTTEDRKEDLKKERKTKRDTLAFTRRHIDVNMSPFKTPVPVQKVMRKANKTEAQEVQKESKESNNEVVKKTSKRLEMLAKWKADKAKQKQQDKANKKPIFKVCHVDTDRSVNLENINKLIKGKAILASAMKKPQFAPTNHKFRPPDGIKPINFNQPTTTKELIKITSKVTTRSHKGIATPSTSKTDFSKCSRLNQKQTEKESAKLAPSSAPSISKTSLNYVERVRTKSSVTAPKPPSVASSVAGNQDKRSTRNLSKQKKFENEKSNKKVENSPRTPIRSSAKKGNEREPIKAEGDTVVDAALKLENELPSKNKQTPVYISPFITISRGKEKAREEYKVRRSYSKENLQSATPEMALILSKHTSPHAGADFFMVKLDSEVDRLNKICEQWETYLKDPELPEEAQSSIGVALGQSKLLIAKKFEQFRGLIVQCKTNNYEEKPITCEDLHGFWDMVYMQVENLDERFANLDRLKANDWIEILPEKKVPVKKVKTRAKKVPVTSRLKDVIKAARQKQKAQNNDNEALLNGDSLAVRSPLREQSVPQCKLLSTSEKKKILRLSSLSSQKRCSSSPGLTMMKISQSIKQGNGLTPAKGILKVDGCKSTGKKSVAFRESNTSPKKNRKALQFDDQNETPTRCLVFDEEEKENTTPSRILRRSSRLAGVSS